MPQKTVGILGGGQLGRMLSQPASLLGIPLLILDSGDKTPAKLITPAPAPHTSHPDGPFNSREHILELASACDVLTVEIEHVNADVLAEIEQAGKCDVQPKASTIKLIQDKYAQKMHLEKHGIAVAPFEAVSAEASRDEWEALGKRLGTPMMLKSRTMAYDGKGNSPLASVSSEDVSSSLSQLGAGTGGKQLSLYAEGWMPFVKEIAVMVVRNVAGEVVSYDAVETIHKDSILRVCIAPLRMHDWDGSSRKNGEDGSVNARAKRLAERAVGVLDGAGVFGVEMFLMQDGEYQVSSIKLTLAGH